MSDRVFLSGFKPTNRIVVKVGKHGRQDLNFPQNLFVVAKNSKNSRFFQKLFSIYPEKLSLS